MPWLFELGMCVVIVGACVSIRDRWQGKKFETRGRIISLIGIGIAVIYLITSGS
ncbi:MAG: hypothetical protein M1352_00555 [Patescibacteria group bacterium]|nr:hypothetical protein [Patescibacteria group bacterium]